ncbi:unnamed protein product [Ranitomeya imitator]|uniref:Pericentrin/AKAP-450 centrosomal targeting domain-containing protein n=1 Tax=Ranitomeya imitator TaxID=111125 RepID=A0ABN9LKV9_9NEOB|nr:unnamed protein product [Ranitomeya imitator]
MSGNTLTDKKLLTQNAELTGYRVYGKYLRSESFRKALVYQKKYLLLLLGGSRSDEVSGERWQRTISPATGTANRNGFGQLIGNEGRTDSPYHPAGSMDLYGDQRLSSCRSRSGFDSPQSTVNSQHRYASSGPSPCSHLQNYDPDRALTDYIARLEALQKRLGSVPSGRGVRGTFYVLWNGRRKRLSCLRTFAVTGIGD